MAGGKGGSAYIFCFRVNYRVSRQGVGVVLG